VSDPDYAAWARAVEACPTVARLSSGPLGTIATHLPNHRVEGLRVADESVEVHVVARWNMTVAQLSDEVRAALAPHTSLPVALHVDDLEDPPSARATQEQGP
jgi:hypothetical protein